MQRAMQSEFMRLNTFAGLPPNAEDSATLLAAAGFYCVNRKKGRVRCFSCGREYQNYLRGTPLENAHDLRCRRRQQNTPLNIGTRSLDQRELQEYINEQDSWTHPVSEDSVQRPGHFDIPNPAPANSRSAQGPRDDTFISTREDTLSHPYSSGYGSVASGNSYGRSLSSARDGPDSGLTDVPDGGGREGATPQHNNSFPAATFPIGANHESGLAPHRPSLPNNLNQLSGAVVQEARDNPSSRGILTSTTRAPLSLSSGHISGNTFEQAAAGEDSTGSENGEFGSQIVNDFRQASYPQFVTAQARRMSFNSWRPQHSHKPEDFVAGGFFYAGYADCVRCFYCGLGLKYWREGDVPAYQHARFRPLCVYNRMYMGQEFVDRVQDEFRSAPFQPQEAANQSSGTSAPGDEFQTARACNSDKQPAVSDSVHMESEAAQGALRAGWSRDEVRRAVDQIVQELGTSCLTTDILLDVLSNLSTENTEEQAPNQHQGSSRQPEQNDSGFSGTDVTDHLSGLVTSSRDSDDDSSGDEASASAQQATSIQLDPADMFRCLETEQTLLKERITCHVCHAQPVSTVYLPCGHVVACGKCADDAVRCIVCDKILRGTATVYFA